MCIYIDSCFLSAISIDELEQMLVKLGVAPMKDPLKRGSASSDKKTKDEEH